MRMAMILLVGHFVGWGWSLNDAFTPFKDGGLPRTQNPLMMMWFVVAVGFICFLYARYTLALSQLPDCRLLHSGAAFMAGNALICLGLSISLMATTIECIIL